MANDINYIQQYQKANTVQVNVRLSKKYDADILAHLNSLDGMGKATYIKELIREDMALRCAASTKAATDAATPAVAAPAATVTELTTVITGTATPAPEVTTPKPASPEGRVIRIEEMAVLIDSSVPTISSWYRWKAQNPEHPAAKNLPDFFRVGPHRNRCWHESDIPAMKAFKASIKQGRNGLMGSVTQKYVKNSKWNKDYVAQPKTEEQRIKEALWSLGADKADEINRGGIC